MSNPQPANILVPFVREKEKVIPPTLESAGVFRIYNSYRRRATTQGQYRIRTGLRFDPPTGTILYFMGSKSLEPFATIEDASRTSHFTETLIISLRKKSEAPIDLEKGLVLGKIAFIPILLAIPFEITTHSSRPHIYLQQTSDTELFSSEDESDFVTTDQNQSNRPTKKARRSSAEVTADDSSKEASVDTSLDPSKEASVDTSLDPRPENASSAKDKQTSTDDIPSIKREDEGDKEAYQPK